MLKAIIAFNIIIHFKKKLLIHTSIWLDDMEIWPPQTDLTGDVSGIGSSSEQIQEWAKYLFQPHHWYSTTVFRN